MTASPPPPAASSAGFDHRDAGTDADAWRPLRARLPDGAAVGAHDHLLVLAAHPDDETLGAGGLIADAALAGAQVTIVVATDGEASHPRSPTVSPERLAELRRREVTAAVAALAAGATVLRLGLGDGQLGAAAAELDAALVGLEGDVTVVAAPWRQDRHGDHQACGLAAARLVAGNGARLLEYPVWGWHWGVPGLSGPMHGDAAGSWVGRRMSDHARAAKSRATQAYRTQHRALSQLAGDEAVLSPATLAHFSGDTEVFLEAVATDLPASYFARLYGRDHDPWRLADGFYEQRKRALVLAALPRPRFRSAFEPGCALGLLTTALADRCDRLLACDVSVAAVERTRAATAGRDHVEVRQLGIPRDWPGGRFDLVVVSELGYYLAEPDVLAGRIRAALSADAVVVGCHWRHPAPGYPSSADEVHAALGRGLYCVAHHVEDDFLLDVWSTSPTSVARQYGVLS